MKDVIHMNDPINLSMEALMAEDGMDVRAGLPEVLRKDLDKLNTARTRTEPAKEKRERVERILASINEREAQIKELQKELAEAMRDYAAAVLGAPAA
jgi:hypothetical protein